MNAKKKGNAGENKFANWLQSKGIKAYKNSSSGSNMWKSDVHNSLDINFEVKTCKKINLLKCWKQTDRDSSMSKATPMLAVHFDGMKDNEWLMILHSEDWIELLNTPPKPQKSSTGQDMIENDRELSYALDQLRIAVQRINKILD